MTKLKMWAQAQAVLATSTAANAQGVHDPQTSIEHEDRGNRILKTAIGSITT